MIVDDNEEMRKALKQLISENPDWTVSAEAANGRDAVTRANERIPDLIILDFAMPVMDGLQTASEIRKTLLQVPILLYTLHKSAEIELQARAAGIQKVLSKVDPSRILIDCLNELLNPPVPKPAIKSIARQRKKQISPVIRGETQ